MRNDEEELVDVSKSICPECLTVIDCKILFRDNRVYQRKYCKTHGLFEALIYSDAEDYRKALKYNKPGTKALHYQGKGKDEGEGKDCPDNCGLCVEHKQHTCVGIIEITDRCNLDCPVCFADANSSFTLPLEQVKEMIDLYVKCEGQPEVIQISGGEPTLHPDICEIIRYAATKGILYIILNTNGLKLADMEFAKAISLSMQGLRRDTLSIKGMGAMDMDGKAGRKPTIFLQFDGFSDDIYTTLRGRPLIDLKMKAINNCKELGMDINLVPTIVKGVNEGEIGPIMDLALNEDGIKAVNFQPATMAGRYGLACDCGGQKPDSRMTIPEVLTEIENQTSGTLRKNSFINVPCPHPTCSACAYVYSSNGNTVILNDLLDVDEYIDCMKNRLLPQVSGIAETAEMGETAEISETKTETGNHLAPDIIQKISAVDRLLSMSTVSGSEKTADAICTACAGKMPDIAGIRNITDVVDNVTLISVHAFMDEFNFDLNRAQKCCVTQILPNGKMIPFCVYNILYRKEVTKGDLG
ncbi:MAG: radical SAM protein [Methanosarcinales archaeon]|nr:radical SAM protein [Methanosarcinales archaeon]